MKQTFSAALALVGFLILASTAEVLAMPSPLEDARHISFTTDGTDEILAQTQPAPAPAPDLATAAAVAPEPIGNVATLTGSATVSRNNATTPLQLQDDIFESDVLQTAANSTLGVTFNDSTTFKLTGSAKIAIDSYVYQDGGQQNGALFDVAKGTVAFVAAAVAKTGDMRIATPTATLGIRGTTGLIEVPQGLSATGANNVAIKLYPDADGRVGRIEVNGRDGTRLGTLTQSATGFAIRAGPGGRLAALPISISPQQALRDQSIVRQVHEAQRVGRQIVTQRRLQRQQNPGNNNPSRNPTRNNPPGNNVPRSNPTENRPENHPAGNPVREPEPPKENGLPQRSGSPQQPIPPNRAGQRQGKPAAPPPGLKRPRNAPELHPGGLQTRQAPAKQRPRGPLPKEKRESEPR